MRSSRAGEVMLRTEVIAVVLAVALVSQPGCAWMINGSTQQIEVRSDPPTARVTVEHIPVAQGPNQIARGSDHVVHAEAQGYEPGDMSLSRSFGVHWIFIDLIFGLVFGILVDLGTGSWYSLSPELAAVKLKPIPGYVPPAPEPKPAPTPAVPTPTAPKATCRTCGAELAPDAKVCPLCGARRG
jgi:hypothetical protein